MQIRQLVSTLALLICWLSGVHAAQLQQDITIGPGNEDSRQILYPGNVTAGSTLIALCSVYLNSGFSTTAPTISDTLGNTWSIPINVGPDDGGGVNLARLYMAYASSPSGGADTVTCDPTGTNSYITLSIIEYSGIATSSPLDRSASNGGLAGTAVTSGTTSATTQPVDLVVAAMTYETNANRTITETAPCTLVNESEDEATFQSIAVCDYTTSSAGTQSAAWTLDGTANWAAGITAFKTVAAPSTRRVHAIIFPLP